MVARMGKTVEDSSQAPWWRGARGEWYVVGQAILGGLVIFGPRTCEGWPAWLHPYSAISALAGAILFLIGGLLFAAGILKLIPYIY
jgi:hypothetical protein